MHLLKRQVTIVFLLTFTLIKISPIYYRYQLLPVFGRGNSTVAIKPGGINDRGNFLVRVDKSIVDEINHPQVPKIKFSGISFELFFAGICLLSLLNYRTLFFPASQSLNAGVYLFQRVLRL
jgi:hypothetical protein